MSISRVGTSRSPNPFESSPRIGSNDCVASTMKSWKSHFILTVEKHQRHIAEVNIKTRHDFHHGEEVSTDMYTSIAAVLDKVEKQILKDKERHGRAEAAQ